MNLYKFDKEKIAKEIKKLLPDEPGEVLVVQYDGNKAISDQLGRYSLKDQELALFVALPNKCAIAYVFSYKDLKVYNRHCLRSSMAYVRSIRDNSLGDSIPVEEMQRRIVIDAARSLKSLVELESLFGDKAHDIRL